MLTLVWDRKELEHQEQAGHKMGWCVGNERADVRKWTCPVGTPFRNEPRIDPGGDNVKNYPARADQADQSGVKSFIYDAVQSYDFCENLVLHGAVGAMAAGLTAAFSLDSRSAADTCHAAGGDQHEGGFGVIALTVDDDDS